MSVNSPSEVFGISAVSRLTGISTHALRVWERRYGVVEPGRSDSKRREYTREEVRRLSLLKTLVDHGHAIRNVAPLTTEQLEQRLREMSESEGRVEQGKAKSRTCRVVFVGALSRDIMREAAEMAEPIKVVGEFSALDEVKSSLREGAVDLLVVEIPHLFSDEVSEIQDLVDQLGARRAIIVYRFATSGSLGPGDKDIRKITAIQAPVDAAELKLACLADVAPLPRADSSKSEPTQVFTEIEGDIPVRKFSEEKLAKIARHSSVVKCECPQHLANLLSSLGAFESYSAECESRNEDDEKLHAYLHRATAECRSAMEAALDHVLAAENIQIDD